MAVGDVNDRFGGGFKELVHTGGARHGGCLIREGPGLGFHDSLLLALLALQLLNLFLLSLKESHLLFVPVDPLLLQPPLLLFEDLVLDHGLELLHELPLHLPHLLHL